MVHTDFSSSSTKSQVTPTSGVQAGGAFSQMPFVLVQSLIVIGINDGEFALGQQYTPKRIAIADAAVQKEQGH
jgi:hypothetical protein